MHTGNMQKIFKNRNFHFMHIHIRVWYYWGAFPFKLSLSADTERFMLDKLNRFQKVSGHSLNNLYLHVDPIKSDL